ncbi:isochorismate synthase [Lysobacter silvisoli]|uniref:isochorismate synthase n=1 Tax=Lysobacter silvisoli TaxID=2293254 RepID=A0A371JZS7_9GAMM|nr:isochorismate synthase [Lysobacter silvisoli]RDZ27166.1 isochorismate synthase [Lysobacter silvisoli]
MNAIPGTLSVPYDSLTPSPPRATSLLRAYRRHDTLFSSSQVQLHARGVLETVDASACDGLAETAREALQRTARKIGRLPLLGAVPFAADAPARLWIPRQAVFAAGQARHGGERRSLPVPLPHCDGVLPQPTAQGYRDSVSAALQRIDAGRVAKVVLSRSLRMQARVSVPWLLERLLSRHPDGYTYAIDLTRNGDSASLVGSSPELLLRKRGAQVLSNPLAGSIPRVADPAEDAQRAQGLLSSAKDRHEHALVVDAVAAALAPHCRKLQVPAAPSLLSTPTMWHLSTRVEGELLDPAASSLQLALALHPTPAVCGYPTVAAQAAIRELEGYDRGLFTGLVGWSDPEGDGEWAVTIRCALVEADAVTAYAGAGVVRGSQPQAELDETSAKLRTMLNAMGLAQVLDVPESAA